MKMEVRKTYRVKKEIFNFKKGEILILADKGYQAYYGEYNFVFVNEEKGHQYQSCETVQMKIWKYMVIWKNILKK